MLSDANARRLYDRYGPEGMRRHGGAEAGTGNARRAWDEFKVGLGSVGFGAELNSQRFCFAPREPDSRSPSCEADIYCGNLVVLGR